ncbi:hypothetical protein RN001_012718 [Aquatica leii]|uniref:Ionotropic glutamate receptor C-terminal domain-containing protein n=1 Tax=Aquatica leii TaxID=1421715 RepID=A0AAN7P6M1_9COLE|nr:hypothetical protein RN001_012718 [Aquatica leii]
MFKLLLILLVLRLNDALKIEHEDYSNVHNCVKKVIGNVVDETATLLFATDSSGSNVFPNDIPNPYIVFDLERPCPLIPKVAKVTNKKQFVIIHAKDYLTVYIIFFSIMQGVYSWKICYTVPALTVMIILPYLTKSDLHELHKGIWERNTVNIVVVTYDTTFKNNTMLVYTTDPQALENRCEIRLDYVNIQNCNGNVTIKFPKLLRKYSYCKLYYDRIRRSSLERTSEITWFVIDTIVETLNITLYYKPPTSQQNYYFSERFAISLRKFNKCYWLGWCTTYFGYANVLCVFPSPKQLAPIESLRITFKTAIWVLILISFVCVAVSWWLISRYSRNEIHEDFIATLLTTYSITLLGSCNRIPTKTALRFVFITYVIYAVHIQTAFNSTLIRILTVPQYELGIQSMEELSESDIPIIISKTNYDIVRDMNVTGIHKKIRGKLLVVDDHVTSTYTDNPLHNYPVFEFDDEFNNVRRVWNYTLYYTIGNTFIGTQYYTFAIYSYLHYSVDNIIVILRESGLTDKVRNDFEYVNKNEENIKNANSDDDGKVVITVNHVYPIFVFWGVGITLATCAFIGELLITFIKNKALRKCFPSIKTGPSHFADLKLSKRKWKICSEYRRKDRINENEVTESIKKIKKATGEDG